MRILVLGASGTIGRAVVAALQPDHDVLGVAHRSGQLTVDLGDPHSIRDLLREAGTLDAIVCAAGAAKFAPLARLSDRDFEFSLSNKLMGQVNLVRYGFAHLHDGGSFTLTSGVLARSPMQGGAAISLVNAALEGFVRGAALEAPRGIRVNVVSPGWVSETLVAMGKDGEAGTPAAAVARSYVESVTGTMTGQVLEPRR
jgi:NAD(P)-dependent dehydrogenase (short-subunit alcohol dehydrogenase family)